MFDGSPALDADPSYARFLLEEILPEVEREQPLRTDAAGRAICGMSSGGICAFTVLSAKVLSF